MARVVPKRIESFCFALRQDRSTPTHPRRVVSYNTSQYVPKDGRVQARVSVRICILDRHTHAEVQVVADREETYLRGENRGVQHFHISDRQKRLPVRVIPFRGGDSLSEALT